MLKAEEVGHQLTADSGGAAAEVAVAAGRAAAAVAATTIVDIGIDIFSFWFAFHF